MNSNLNLSKTKANDKKNLYGYVSFHFWLTYTDITWQTTLILLSLSFTIVIYFFQNTQWAFFSFLLVCIYQLISMSYSLYFLVRPPKEFTHIKFQHTGLSSIRFFRFLLIIFFVAWLIAGIYSTSWSTLFLNSLLYFLFSWIDMRASLGIRRNLT